MLDTDRLISFTRDIVRIQSLSGEEAQVSRRIEEEMTALGFDRVWTDSVGNVVGVLEGAEPGPTIVFDAHTDTVGVSPGVPWELDPFSGGGAGRGAARPGGGGHEGRAGGDGAWHWRARPGRAEGQGGGERVGDGGGAGGCGAGEGDRADRRGFCCELARRPICRLCVGDAAGRKSI